MARKVRPKVLHLLFNKLCLKMIDHGSRSTWAQVLPDPDERPKNMIRPTKMVLPYNFCLIKFLPNLTGEAVDAPHTMF